jgi:hypothetical protein
MKAIRPSQNRAFLSLISQVRMLSGGGVLSTLRSSVCVGADLIPKHPPTPYQTAGENLARPRNRAIGA